MATRAKRRKPTKKRKPTKCLTKAQKKHAKGKRKKLPVCKPKRKPKPTQGPVNTPLLGAAPSTPQPAPSIPVAPPPPGAPTPAVPSPPEPPAGTRIDSPIPMYAGPFGIAEAERLLWRAGFGPRPGEAAEFAALGLEQAVIRLTRPRGNAVLTGPEPTDKYGQPLEPIDLSGHDHAYWFDRMIRGNQPLVERLALVFHDWFATSMAGVDNQAWMLDQTNLFRKHGLGSFKDLVHDMSQDFAMLRWLDAGRNVRGRVNENYARELMELFTLGTGRDAYTETDIREAARSLTGFAEVWTGVDPNPYVGSYEFRLNNHDTGSKTVFGQTGNWDWTDIARMVIDHPKHPGFFVTKLWSYFIPTPPSDAQRQALESRYVDAGYQVRPVLEAILCSPDLYAASRMVKPPVVYHAGMMRALGRYVKRTDWHWFTMMAGQRLYYPPDVSGWDDKRWLDTNTLRWRWGLASQAFLGLMVPGTDYYTYDAAETAAQALERALNAWANPRLSEPTRDHLFAFAAKFDTTAPVKAQRQNILRQLIPCTPDYLTC
jgi:uncharacterized protein (DUF1800 family)